MTVLSSGVDIVEVARIERVMARQGARFSKRFFTEEELVYCNGRAERLAGRFAVKEAVAKALGTGIGDVSGPEIEVRCDGRGKPELLLHGRARALAKERGLHNWSISLSHTTDSAAKFS